MGRSLFAACETMEAFCGLLIGQGRVLGRHAKGKRREETPRAVKAKERKVYPRPKIKAQVHLSIIKKSGCA